MTKMHLMIAGAVSSLLLLSPTYAQQTDLTGVDPLCIKDNADGTKSVDMVKCPDGKTMPSATNNTGTTADPAQDATVTPQPGKTDGQVTGSTAPAGEVIVPMDVLNSATILSANDYIGKTVYDSGGNNIGDVNDLVMSQDGKVQATILGVGGFLGIGEKNVAVPVAAVQVINTDGAVRLVVNATKAQLDQAPSYDTTSRRYPG
jgi:sporulation protein YlmC with PRC-barrel domain